MGARWPVESVAERCVAVGPWQLKVLEVGEGEPIVLVHGLGTSVRCWQHNLAALAACGRVIAVDLPGFGESETPDRVLDAEALAEVLLDWCEVMALRRARFIGHSLGGEVCLWLAAKRPELIDRLVLAGSTGSPESLRLRQRLIRLLWDGLHEPPRFLPVLLHAYYQAGLRRMLHTARISDPVRLAPHLPTIQAPTLVAWGANDPVVPLGEARRLANELPNGPLVVLATGAHGLIFDAPAPFNRVVCDFLTASALTGLAKP